MNKAGPTQHETEQPQLEGYADLKATFASNAPRRRAPVVANSQ